MSTTTTTTTPRSAAAHLWNLGANITAIASGGKKPAHEWNNTDAPWATTRQPAEFVPSLGQIWSAKDGLYRGRITRAVETIGVICGVNGWRWLDVDARKEDGAGPVPDSVRAALLEALGLPDDYPWAGRSRSGRGLHIAVRCHGELPAELAAAVSEVKAADGGGAGVKIGLPLDAYAEAFDHIELRWEHCQTVLPGPTGYNGHLPDEPPAEVSVEQLVSAFYALATPKPRKGAAAPQAPAQSATRPATGPRERFVWNDTVRAAIRDRFDLVEWFTRELGGETQEERGEVRILGHNGLMVDPDKGVWRIHGEELGGEWVEAIQHTRYGGQRQTGAAFFDLVRIAADFAGVKLEAEPQGPQAARAEQPAASARPLPTLTRGFVLMCLKEEEAGDAQLFTRLFRGEYIYDRAAAAWYEFQGHAWRRMSGPPRPAVWGRTAAAYLALATELQAELEKAPEDDQKKLAAQVEQLMGRVKQLRRLNRCNAVLTLAGDPGMLSIDGTEWDVDPWALAVGNGILDLRTGELRPGRPEDYIRTAAPTPWAGLNTPAPRWERFVSEVMSDEADRVTFLQRALGYALNGTTREHMLVLLVGERGRNGKGVLFEMLRRILGDYAGAVHSDVITGQQKFRTAGAAQPHLVDLRGKRIAYTSETAEGDQMGAAQVKLITGGDAIRARQLHENLVEFTPTHTLFVATNRRPHAPADDDALWERVKVLEFKARFVDEPQAPDERQRDPKLAEGLGAEASGILAWLVRGHIAYLRDGLRTPESVKMARDAYRKGESLDPFIDACCAEWDGGDAEAGALWEAYRVWCDAEGLRPKSQHWFGRQLATRYEKGRTATGRTCYYGVSLNPEKVQAAEKGSERIRTPQTAPAAGGATRFSEPSHRVSDLIPQFGPHEGRDLENGSEGSEGSDLAAELAPVVHHPDGDDLDPLPYCPPDVGEDGPVPPGVPLGDDDDAEIEAQAAADLDAMIDRLKAGRGSAL